MNERIKKLAEQTGYIWHTSGDPQIYEFTPEKLEKFAELIVRECVLISRTSSDGFSAGKQMEEHFGVEE